MYELVYDSTTGKVIGLVKNGSSIPFSEMNPDYQEFLSWNKVQETPLDLNSTIETYKLTYQELRALAYPKLQDQMDMIYWDKINNTTTWQDAIAKVKKDIPKV